MNIAKRMLHFIIFFSVVLGGVVLTTHVLNC